MISKLTSVTHVTLGLGATVRIIPNNPKNYMFISVTSLECNDFIEALQFQLHMNKSILDKMIATEESFKTSLRNIESENDPTLPWNFKK